MELPKIKLEQLELEHEAPKTTLPFHLKKLIINKIRHSKSDYPLYAIPRKKYRMCKITAHAGLKRHARTPNSDVFPILGAHISGAKFLYSDLTWKEICGQWLIL